MNGNRSRRRRFSSERDRELEERDYERRRQRRSSSKSRRGFFRSSAKGKVGGKWTTEDWYFTAAIIALAFLFLWLANNYRPFIDAPVSVFS